MKTETILTITTILQIAIVSITFADGRFDNPQCHETLRNDAPSGKTLLLFMIGYASSHEYEIERIFYVLKQTACWIPDHPEIKSAVSYAGQGINEFRISTDSNETRKLLKEYSEQIPTRTQDGFLNDLSTMNNQSELQGFDKVIIIANQAYELDFYAYFTAFKNAGLGGNFKFSQVIFYKPTDSNYEKLVVKDYEGVTTGSPIASESLRLATRAFMDNILDRSTSDEPLADLRHLMPRTPPPVSNPRLAPNAQQATTEQAKEEGFPMMYIIIGAVVAVIILILLIIAIVVCCVCRKKKKEKKSESKRKPKKSGKSKDLEKNGNKKENSRRGKKTPSDSKSQEKIGGKSAEPVVAAASAESPAVPTPSKEGSTKKSVMKSKQAKSDGTMSELAFLKNKPREEEKKKSTLSESLSLSPNDDSLAQQDKTQSFFKKNESKRT
ncbi:unnamed protein product [Caenorhabditis angaria]|uniref:VWFA domain-containing protein n=1 Tax=Caenorhabditis angaria TaxID=860376 RepID=A0A9P1IK36_9PELO|nr:unnamed protein product [Caenorhabditis angaria]